MSAGGAGGGASLMGAPALLSLLPQGGLLQASKAQVLNERNSLQSLHPMPLLLMFLVNNFRESWLNHLCSMSQVVHVKLFQQFEVNNSLPVLNVARCFTSGI